MNREIFSCDNSKKNWDIVNTKVSPPTTNILKNEFLPYHPSQSGCA